MDCSQSFDYLVHEQVTDHELQSPGPADRYVIRDPGVAWYLVRLGVILSEVSASFLTFVRVGSAPPAGASQVGYQWHNHDQQRRPSGQRLLAGMCLKRVVEVENDLHKK